MIFLPALLVIIPIILIQLLKNGRPIIFAQKRIGYKGKLFTLYKLRTMTKDAEDNKEKYQSLNQVDGPVFKIDNDPRFVHNGRWISRTGIDEIPQLINVLLGHMSLVGPRPLPAYEEQHISTKWRSLRRQAKPGIMSSWVLHGAHRLSFSHWMQLDAKYVKSGTLANDMYIIIAVLFHQLKEITVLLFQKSDKKMIESNSADSHTI